MRTKLLVLLVLMATANATFAQKTKSLRWKIRNPTWNNEFDLAYQNFVHTLGVARKNGQCHTTDECLRSPIANPQYFRMNPSRLQNIFSDCADLPFILRAYFSWMNDLPFSYPTELVEAKGFTKTKKDIRYSRFGNIVTRKRYVENGDNVNKIFKSVSDMISTASFRTDASKNDTGDLFRDTYPADIDRKSIVPGTVLYDPNGHVAVVYDVTTNGKILLIDAHPDNSLTALTYGEKFARTSVKVGGGFSNFRPFSVAGDEIGPVRNADLPGYSLIQYQKGPFIFKGRELTFYEYVRNKLADGDVVYDPISEFNDQLDELCQDVKNREESVNSSLQSGLQNQYHPETLPLNIYGADGEWEAYASPSRDARIKTEVNQIKDFLTKVIAGNTARDPSIKFMGDNLVEELRNIYFSKTESCVVHPTQETTLDLDEVLTNLFALSFDPYHCAELRWGLTGTKSCQTTANKMRWYMAEQGLRNRIDRDYSIRTDYDVYSLPNAPVSAVSKPDLSLDKILEIVR
ncbi:MAG: hypothetical protein ACXVLQ_14770 [Bacteriovorax sp.]